MDFVLGLPDLCDIRTRLAMNSMKIILDLHRLYVSVCVCVCVYVYEADR